MRFTMCSLLISSVLITGCSIKHPISQDYNSYLSNNNDVVLPHSSLNASYSIEGATLNHHYEFKSGLAGPADVWIVDFGDILQKNLEAPYVQNAFASLKKSTGNATDGKNIQFKLDNYVFKNHRAFVDMTITFTQNGSTISSKQYHEEGVSQGAKMFLAGGFGMKNAVQQSTKSAIDKVLTKFINDVNSSSAQ